MKNNSIKSYFTSSLEKVFCDEPFYGDPISSGSMLLNEHYSFQLAFVSEECDYRSNYTYSVNSPIKEFVDVRLVTSEPASFVCWSDCDDNLLRKTPGLYPDILGEYPKNGIKLLKGQWRSLWITVSPRGRVKPGNYSIEIFLFEFGLENKPIIAESFNLEIINESLPETDLIYTRWFHYDCIANYYGIDVFSEQFWEITESYIKTAADYGMNTILTPIFTPPLDTYVGGERATVQLVDVKEADNAYTFAFDKLTRFIQMCRRCGIKNYEFSHLFTQWGAKNAPKIVVSREGDKYVKFGWHTDSKSYEYVSFLDSFLTALVEYINQNGLSENVFFHVSDEPDEKAVEAYTNNAGILRRHIGNMKIIDASSSYEVYKKANLDIALPANDGIDEFIEKGVSELWTYYCTCQYKEVSNQFFNMPSARNRIIGLQFYKYGIKGFLQWGYNFWNTCGSYESINPYIVSDAGGFFQSGDAFAVYPGENCAISSIRLAVFREALQDLNALRLLEQKIGRAEVIKLMETGLQEEITFKTYPHSSKWLIDFRETVNRML